MGQVFQYSMTNGANTGLCRCGSGGCRGCIPAATGVKEQYEHQAGKRQHWELWSYGVRSIHGISFRETLRYAQGDIRENSYNWDSDSFSLLTKSTGLSSFSPALSTD